jgi:hypothetical protein
MFTAGSSRAFLRFPVTFVLGVLALPGFFGKGFSFQSAFVSDVFWRETARGARVFRSFGEIARTRRKNMVFSQD